MGFYPVTPGSGLYAIGSPFFPKVEIKLPNGELFTIKSDNVSKKNKYIQSAKLNGEELNTAWIRHTDITAGGMLEFVMGDRPNKEWGTEAVK
jgi:putative alpha-1,2-mannosidase